jgi:hypothetical protein
VIWVKGDQILLVEITICEKVLENRNLLLHNLPTSQHARGHTVLSDQPRYKFVPSVSLSHRSDNTIKACQRAGA